MGTYNFLPWFHDDGRYVFGDEVAHVLLPLLHELLLFLRLGSLRHSLFRLICHLLDVLLGYPTVVKSFLSTLTLHKGVGT